MVVPVRAGPDPVHEDLEVPEVLGVTGLVKKMINRFSDEPSSTSVHDPVNNNVRKPLHPIKLNCNTTTGPTTGLSAVRHTKYTLLPDSPIHHSVMAPTATQSLRLTSPCAISPSRLESMPIKTSERTTSDIITNGISKTNTFESYNNQQTLVLNPTVNQCAISSSSSRNISQVISAPMGGTATVKTSDDCNGNISTDLYSQRLNNGASNPQIKQITGSANTTNNIRQNNIGKNNEDMIFNKNDLPSSQ